MKAMVCVASSLLICEDDGMCSKQLTESVKMMVCVASSLLICEDDGMCSKQLTNL